MTHPRLTPRARFCPQTQVSLPTRGLQLCALPPGANGLAGSSIQSPPKLLMYTKVSPFAFVTVLPFPPEIAPVAPGGRCVLPGAAGPDDGRDGEDVRTVLRLDNKTPRTTAAIATRANTTAAKRTNRFLLLDFF